MKKFFILNCIQWKLKEDNKENVSGLLFKIFLPIF